MVVLSGGGGGGVLSRGDGGGPDQGADVVQGREVLSRGWWSCPGGQVLSRVGGVVHHHPWTAPPPPTM